MSVFTAKIGNNGDIFPEILRIYARPGNSILDMTYGKGVFWAKVDRTNYTITTNDLVTPADISCDFRNMPSILDAAFDVVVLDPPYAYSPKGTMKSSIADCYRLNDSVDISNMNKVQELYGEGIKEARRILKAKGILIIKTQDIIQAGKQWWMHVWMMNQVGFICEDLFVLVQDHEPAMDPKWKVQQHARKNHSFFVILRKVVR